MKPEEYLHLYLGQKCVRSSHHEPQSETYTLTSYNLPEAIEFADRLILRSIDQVTDREWDEIAYKIEPAGLFTGGEVKLSFVNHHPDYRPGWTLVNKALNELRALGVDVDGLIEAGLALHKF